MQSLSNCQALTGREQLSQAGSSLKAVSDGQRISPRPLAGHQMLTQCKHLLYGFENAFSFRASWRCSSPVMILHLRRYLVLTLLFFSKFCIIECMYVACHAWIGETEYLELIISSFSCFQSTEYILFFFPGV